MVFIISKNNDIISVCDTLINVYNNIVSYCKIIYYSNIDLLLFNDIQIFEYHNGNIINIYYFNINDYYIYDINNVKYLDQDIMIEKHKSRLIELFKNNDLNIHIPLNNNDIRVTTEDECQNIYIKSHDYNKIEKLKEKIDKEKKKLEDNNNIYDNNLNNYLKHKHKYTLFKTKIKNKKEREEEKFRKFKVAKNTFNIVNDEIKNKTRNISDVPELFKNDYNIFLYIKEKYQNISDTEEYNKYITIMKNIELEENNIQSNFDDIFKDNIIYKNLQENLSNYSDDSEDS